MLYEESSIVAGKNPKVLGLALLYLGANRNLQVHKMEKYTRSEAICLI